MYLYETHMHTKEGSLCASAEAEDMVGELAKRGYCGAVVTDHFYTSVSYSPDRRLPWREQMDLFCRSYESAKRAGDRLGIDIFFGFEITMISYDILVYGLSPEYLISHPELQRFAPAEIVGAAKAQGVETDVALAAAFRDLSAEVHAQKGYLAAAHPCRNRPHPIDDFVLDNVDGLELYNGSYTNQHFPELVYAGAKSRGLNLQAGSDAHSVDRLNNGVWFSEKPGNIHDFISLLRRQPPMKAVQCNQKISPNNPVMVG